MSSSEAATMTTTTVTAETATATTMTAEAASAVRLIEMDATFYSLFVICVLAGALTGGTLQWVYKNKLNTISQYNILVTTAAISSLIQTVACYLNYLHAPNTNLNFMIFILVNWVIMTHSSVMLVSNRLALTTKQPHKTWCRLLLINLFIFPISIFICVYWSMAHNFDNETIQKINSIMEPVQIALWGFIEFCLSGAFIVKMWKFHWSIVERKAVFVLCLVSVCDIISILLNLFLGDLESTCVKGFVYCLRIKLEVDVLVTMVDFVKSKRQRNISGININNDNANTTCGGATTATTAGSGLVATSNSSVIRRNMRMNSNSASSRSYSISSLTSLFKKGVLLSERKSTGGGNTTNGGLDHNSISNSNKLYNASSIQQQQERNGVLSSSSSTMKSSIRRTNSIEQDDLHERDITKKVRYSLDCGEGCTTSSSSSPVLLIMDSHNHHEYNYDTSGRTAILSDVTSSGVSHTAGEGEEEEGLFLIVEEEHDNVENKIDIDRNDGDHDDIEYKNNKDDECVDNDCHHRNQQQIQILQQEQAPPSPSQCIDSMFQDSKKDDIEEADCRSDDYYNHTNHHSKAGNDPNVTNDIAIPYGDGVQDKHKKEEDDELMNKQTTDGRISESSQTSQSNWTGRVAINTTSLIES